MDKTGKIGMAAVGVVLLVIGMWIGISGYQEYQAYRLMQANVVGLVKVINYNLQAGHVAVPPAPGAPTPAPVEPVK